jgi:hypothetical protein
LSPHSDAIGFVRGKPPGQSIDTFRNSAHHNGSMGSFGKTDSGRSRLLSQPISPIMPLGSSENRGRHDCNHASSAPPGPRPFSWGGVTIPMVMTVRLVIRLSASSEGGEIGFVRGARAADAIGFVRGNGACGRAHVVDRYELSKSGARKASNFIIGRTPRARLGNPLRAPNKRPSPRPTPGGRGRKTGPLSRRERVRVRETSGAVGKVRRSNPDYSRRLSEVS